MSFTVGLKWVFDLSRLQKYIPSCVVDDIPVTERQSLKDAHLLIPLGFFSLSLGNSLGIESNDKGPPF